MILRLTDGTTTLSLIGGPARRRQYAPRGPELSVIAYEPASLADGGEAAAITRRNITETCEITITAATEADVQTVIQDIELLFLGAIEYQNRRGGARLYVEFAANDAWDVHRSEILYGRLELADEALSTWPQVAVEVTLHWQRRYYWEGPEVALTLANSFYSGSAGIPIWNCDDSSYDNYVDIDGDDVAGTLPAPVKLVLANDFHSARLTNVIIGHNVYADPSDLAHILEGEDADDASPTGDANCSGGAYAYLSWAGDTQDLAATWTIASAALSHFRGRYFRLWARLSSALSEATYVQAKLLYPDATAPNGIGSVIAEGTEMLLAGSGGQLQDFGVLQIPPWLMGDAADLRSVIVALYGRKVGGGALLLDFVQLTPLDSYRELVMEIVDRRREIEPRGRRVADPAPMRRTPQQRRFKRQVTAIIVVEYPSVEQHRPMIAVRGVAELDPPRGRAEGASSHTSNTPIFRNLSYR